MMLVGFLILSFKEILIYFFSFMHQHHMGFITISETTYFGLSKKFLLSPKIFCKSWKARQGMEKLGLDPSSAPIRDQTLAKTFTIMHQNHIYCNSIILLPKK